MPTVTPNGPDEFAVFEGEYGHVRHHRAMEAAIEGLDTALNSTGTVSTVALIATRVGFGFGQGDGRPGRAVHASCHNTVFKTSMMPQALPGKVFSPAPQATGLEISALCMTMQTVSHHKEQEGP